MKRVFWIVGLVLLCAPLALADAPQTGVVTGTVIDPSGAAMPGVTVQLISEQGTMTNISDADGKFMFVFLVPGMYTVQADMSGFQSAAGEIIVSAGGRADVALQLGEAMGEEIVVTGESPLVDKFDMTGGGTVTRDELDAITGTSNEYKSRLMFMPDVTNDPGSDRSLGREPSIAGFAGRRSMYFIDGFDVSFGRSGGGSQLELPVAAVSEMKLESSGADAEYSRAIGGITKTIIRSGTNSLHGSASWKGENLAWNAKNKVVETERPDQTFHAYDFTLGGPFVKDKLWFFVTGRHEETAAYDVMADGESVVQEGATGDSWLAKFDWRPNPSHSIGFLATETPYEFPFWARNTSGNIETVAWFEWGGDILTARWNWAINDSLLLTATAGTTEAEQVRTNYVESNIEAGCGPEDPCGNDWRYRPYSANARWPNAPYAALNLNGNYLPLGRGYTNFPRDQLNANIEWFTGVHDIKVGVDYQKVGWDAAGVTVPFCRGRSFDEYAPGGFESNADPVTSQRAWCAFYPTKATWADGYGPIDFGSDNTALFIKDRIALKKWTLNLGLRADQQVHENDVGETTLDTTDIVPRLAASYDVLGDSTLILNGSAGRYYANVELAWSRNFNIMPIGTVQYELYRWNRTSMGYDDLFRVVGAASGLEIVEVDPYYKDELQVGAEWQFHRNWALKFRALYWETKDYPVIRRQMDPVDGLYNEVLNTEATKEREAFTISIQRRFRNGWMVGANYTYSRNLDSCFYGADGGCSHNYGELEEWTMEDGTQVSHWPYPMRSYQDRPHVGKVRGTYNWRLGKGHSLNIAGLAYFNSGRAWSRGETQTYPEELPDPLDQNPTRFVYEEPYGAERLNTRYQLDLNLEWRFPIGGDFSGYVRGEVLNVTDEQELLAITGLPNTGIPSQSTSNYQYPRMLRMLAGFQF
jgi:hypothetical protein